ncbi:MAG: biopolymer transporter ExbD [Acidobacteria bacterium]|nr:biopolymer transporter ExbD [Acidobacteriota bacterium]
MNNVNRRKLTANPEINVTPLIDVLLVLLIIFMVISPAIASKFDAKLPEKLEQEKKNIESPMLVVTVTSSGDYMLNLDPVSTLEDLQDSCSALSREDHLRAKLYSSRLPGRRDTAR